MSAYFNFLFCAAAWSHPATAAVNIRLPSDLQVVATPPASCLLRSQLSQLALPLAHSKSAPAAVCSSSSSCCCCSYCSCCCLHLPTWPTPTQPTGASDPVCRFLCSLHFSYRQFARLISDQQSASSAFAANRIRTGRTVTTRIEIQIETDSKYARPVPTSHNPAQSHRIARARGFCN